jgi:NADP-dependent 3-hydroxy acid dehydrogenase YdfG
MLAKRGAKVVLDARGLDRLEARARRRSKRSTLNIQRPMLNEEGDGSGGRSLLKPGEKLRVTIISPGFVRTNFAEGVTNPVRAPPEAIARAIVFAIEQPADVDVGEIIVRPTAQS